MPTSRRNDSGTGYGQLAPARPGGKAAWSIEEFIRACNFSRSFFYSLPPEKRPRAVRVTPRKLVIIEAPSDYLARIGDPQG